MDFQDSAISVVLQKTQEKFLSMLNEQKDQLISMFPELFSEMRTTSSLLDIPQTAVETVVNPDGSTTTRTRCSRAYRLINLNINDRLNLNFLLNSSMGTGRKVFWV